jgi:uncharacterized membrane protein YfcA
VSVAEAGVVFAAAFIAGLVNSVAGGGTLVSFPALVWLGRDPIIANTTNAVALWPGSLASAIGFRRELRGGRPLLLRLVLPSIAGGAVGAMLLLRTPSRTFAAIVPFLIFFATLLFAFQEPITRRLHGHAHGAARDSAMSSGAWWMWAAAFQFTVAIYGGYFGAGMGILMLAALGLLGLTDIHQMNGLKNVFATCINGIAAVYFAACGAVNWPDALVMAAGAIVGGYGGAGLARRFGRRFVRRAVVVIGVTMGLSLLLRPR